MKAGLFVGSVAALVAQVAATPHNHAHLHRREAKYESSSSSTSDCTTSTTSSCTTSESSAMYDAVGTDSPVATSEGVCKVYTTTIYGDATLVAPVSAAAVETSTECESSVSSMYAEPTWAMTYSATGVYTVPACTITVTASVEGYAHNDMTTSYGPGVYVADEKTVTVTESDYTCAYEYSSVKDAEYESTTDCETTTSEYGYAYPTGEAEPETTIECETSTYGYDAHSAEETSDCEESTSTYGYIAYATVDADPETTSECSESISAYGYQHQVYTSVIVDPVEPTSSCDEYDPEYTSTAVYGYGDHSTEIVDPVYTSTVVYGYGDHSTDIVDPVYTSTPVYGYGDHSTEIVDPVSECDESTIYDPVYTSAAVYDHAYSAIEDPVYTSSAVYGHVDYSAIEDPVSTDDCTEETTATAYAAASSTDMASPADVQPASYSAAPYSAPAAEGSKWAMTYTPYNSAGKCKTAAEVEIDIGHIASMGFTTVRTYATDCDALPNIGGACTQHKLKLIVGIFIGDKGIASAREQADAVCSWRQWDIVEMIVVGNEAIFNGYTNAVELSAFIVELKGRFKGDGYTGPVTTTEPLGTLQECAAQLCPVIDVVAANLQAYFNPQTTADHAGEFIAAELILVGKVCPGLEAYNLESGWPSAGSANGVAIPGVDEQRTAVLDIVKYAGSRSAIFSYENDEWKHDGSLAVEKHWGCSSHFA